MGAKSCTNIATKHAMLGARHGKQGQLVIVPPYGGQPERDELVLLATAQAWLRCTPSGRVRVVYRWESGCKRLPGAIVWERTLRPVARRHDDDGGRGRWRRRCSRHTSGRVGRWGQ